MNSLKIYYLEILKYICSDLCMNSKSNWENEWLQIHNHLKMTQYRKFSANSLKKFLQILLKSNIHGYRGGGGG